MNPIKAHLLRKVSTIKIGETICVLNNDGTVFRCVITNNPIRNRRSQEWLVEAEKENGEEITINDTDIIFNPKPKYQAMQHSFQEFSDLVNQKVKETLGDLFPNYQPCSLAAEAIPHLKREWGQHNEFFKFWYSRFLNYTAYEVWRVVWREEYYNKKNRAGKDCAEAVAGRYKEKFLAYFN